MDTDHIIRLADAFASGTGRTASTVSTYAANDGKWLDGLRSGNSCTLRKARAVIEWFDAHWPADLEWPRDIPRPSKSKEAA